MTWASFRSLSINSSTEEIRTPAFLFGGSVTSTTSISDLTSTFNSCGVYFLMTFDFAFMMLGSVAYLGWFSLRSVLRERNKQEVNPKPSHRRQDIQIKTHSPLPQCKKNNKKIINISSDKHSSYKPSSYAEKGVKADKFKSSKLLDATKYKMRKFWPS